MTDKDGKKQGDNLTGKRSKGQGNRQGTGPSPIIRRGVGSRGGWEKSCSYIKKKRKQDTSSRKIESNTKKNNKRNS